MSKTPWSRSKDHQSIAKYLTADRGGDRFTWGCLLGWWSIHALGRVAGQDSFEGRSRSWIDEWLLGKVLAVALQDLGLGESTSWEAVGLIKILTTHQNWYATKAIDAPEQVHQVTEVLLKDGDVQQFLHVNRYQGVLWFQKEAFEQLLWWLMEVATIRSTAFHPWGELDEDLPIAYGSVKRLLKAKDDSGYQIEELLKLL